MTSFVPDIERSKMGSPDRLDALVWALTDLIVERQKFDGLFEVIREELAEAARSAG
jgi:phage terminase large subunit-like protein